MKRAWSDADLSEHWHLFPREKELLVNKHGTTRLGFALLLKFFQLEGRFPASIKEIRECYGFREITGSDLEQLRRWLIEITWPPVMASQATDWELIEQQLDTMVKHEVGMKRGMANAECLLRRFTRPNIQHPAYKALTELGKAIKTIFLCRYLPPRICPGR